ncbi:tumor necrosis factor receptor superfamily member 14-like isoform X2 [Dicentrarchus labrax]|uniref:tumor necrosis factor receptor superfamily member 14-like isoform X2 n=1 Tax=Dicentrarchus labrax TaxID=13489 RepID=UPI0021F5ACBC|nr:tumor necrosis factor receptor superfamily member 14-like isoform X2 [Dicentrarchus labrax]
MMFGRKPLTAAPLLILVMNIFRGHALQCHPSEYQRGNECCPKCLPGSRVKTDCTEFRSTSCLSCTEGTFINQPTVRTQCYSCTVCIAGSGLKIKTSCTTTSDTVCEPLEGFYCLDSTEDGCMSAQRHTLCQPGQYISQKGTALTDTECSDCSAGTYSDGTFPSCQPHTQCESMNLLIKAGTVSTDAQCGEQSSQPTGIVIGVVGSCPETQVKVKEGSTSSNVVCGSSSRNYYAYIPLLLSLLTVAGLVTTGRLTMKKDSVSSSGGR